MRIRRRSMEQAQATDKEDSFDIMLKLKHSKNRSWVQLRNGCLDLIGRPVNFTTQPVRSTSRLFARESQKRTGLSFEEILRMQDERQLGLKN